MKPRVFYQLKRHSTSAVAAEYSDRSEAICALLHAIFVLRWDAGSSGAALYQYELQQFTQDDYFLQRRWYFSKMPMQVGLAHKKMVLCITNVLSGDSGPVCVADCNEDITANRWILQYRLAHWLKNASTAQLRHAAMLLGFSWDVRWMFNKNRKREEIYKIAARCSNERVRMRLPRHEVVFSFEPALRSSRVFKISDYWRD